MSKENEGNEPKPEVIEKKKESKPKKELTLQEMQKRKKMLVYPLFVLLFIGTMWLIFAPDGGKDEKQPDGFNPELPIPKDEGIVGDKRKAYEQEAMRNKEENKRRNLQDFAFSIGEDEDLKTQEDYESKATGTDGRNSYNYSNSTSRSTSTIQSSAQAYQDVNRQLGTWYEQPATEVDEQAQLELEFRIQELERQLQEKSAADEQLELIEKSYQIAAKYTPNAQEQVTPDGQQQQNRDNTINLREKVTPKPVSQVHHRDRKSVV